MSKNSPYYYIGCSHPESLNVYSLSDPTDEIDDEWCFGKPFLGSVDEPVVVYCDEHEYSEHEVQVRSG